MKLFIKLFILLSIIGCNTEKPPELKNYRFLEELRFTKKFKFTKQDVLDWTKENDFELYQYLKKNDFVVYDAFDFLGLISFPEIKQNFKDGYFPEVVRNDTIGFPSLEKLHKLPKGALILHTPNTILSETDDILYTLKDKEMNYYYSCEKYRYFLSGEFRKYTKEEGEYFIYNGRIETKEDKVLGEIKDSLISQYDFIYYKNNGVTCTNQNKKE